jgi:hypothetical protein
MALRQPRTAILTATLLAAASANPAWADCEQLRQQMVGQYGVVVRYQEGVNTVSHQCDQILAARVVDTNAFAQCDASLHNLQAGYQQANATYQQQYASFSAQCRTTATYNGTTAPSYATDPEPYYGQPSASQPNQSSPATDQDVQNITSFAQPDATQTINAGIGAYFNGGGLGFGGGRSGGGSRGGGSKRPC